LFERLGDPQRALAAVRQRPYMKGWPRYLATALRSEARLAQTVGDAAGAVAARERVLALRTLTSPRSRAETDAAPGGARAARP
jgi:hypothetical protein